MTTLTSLAIGQQATVSHIAEHDAAYRKKLLALGLLPGTPVTVIRVAPLGDPIEIRVRGFNLCLRKAEASAIEVTL